MIPDEVVFPDEQTLWPNSSGKSLSSTKKGPGRKHRQGYPKHKRRALLVLRARAAAYIAARAIGDGLTVTGRVPTVGMPNFQDFPKEN